MTRRHVAMLGVAAVVVAAAVTAFALLPPHAPDGSPSAPVADVGAPQAVNEPAAAPAPVVPAADAAAPVPPFAPKFAAPAESLPDLLTRARAGDVEAMADLGMGLEECRADKLADLRRRIRRLESRDRNVGEVGQDAGVAARSEARAEGMRQTIARCESVPPEERDRAFAWIERAAAAGDPDARHVFYTRALAEFADEAAIIANIDEVERRRDVARRFAREDLDACVEGVFGQQAEAFDLLGMTDAADRLAILYAGSRAESDVDAALRAATAFDEEAAAADEIAVIEGRRRGAALHAHCER